MFELNTSLPAGALISRSREGLRRTLSGSSAIWLEGDETRFELGKNNVISKWTAGAHQAAPTTPNTGNGRFVQQDGRSGLGCVAQQNCGFVVNRITENASRFTMAVIYRDREEHPPQTLLTLNTATAEGAGKGYMFLSDDGSNYTAKDTGGALEIVTPRTPSLSGSRMVVVTLSGDKLAIASELGPVTVTKGADPDMRKPADLFIGCRSHRKGLKKTLGASLIQEVFFWPDHTLLLPRGELDSEQYTALKRYYLWEH